MATPMGRIRSFQPSDDKEVRFIIGQANMELLAAANRRAYTHPLTLSAWFVLSCLFIEYMHWWPNVQVHGWLGYLSPVPAFASVAVPILALVDWINRPYFDEATVDTLRQRDIIDIPAYYSRRPSSGLWILEYNEKLIGIIALDAAPQVDPDETPSKKKKSSPTAIIRHFYVEDPYRQSNIQTDLLTHAVEHAFRSGASLERIEASESSLARYIQKSLRSFGFQLKEHTQSVGIYRWKLSRSVLERSEWEKREEARKTR